MLDLFFKDISNLLLSQDYSGKIEKERFWKVKHVDLYEYQNTREKDIIKYETPSVFVDFSPSSAAESGNVIQENHMINFHVEAMDWGSAASNSHNQSESLMVLQFLECVKATLLAWTPIERWGRLEYRGRRIDQSGRNNPTHILTFFTAYSQRREC